MFARSYHALTALLPLSLFSCQPHGRAGIPVTILDGCPADIHLAGKIAALEDLPFSALLDQLAAHQFTTRWEPDGGGGGIIRAVQHDPLTGKTTTLAMEVSPKPGSNDFPSCSRGVTLVSRMQVDGQLMDGFELDDSLLSLIEQARAARPQVAPAPARPALSAQPPARLPGGISAPDQQASVVPALPMPPVAGAAARGVIASDDETWCCLTVGRIAQLFSGGGASTTISATSGGGLALAITDPTGRWRGWRSFTLTLAPDAGGTTTPLRPKAIIVDGRTVLTDDPAADDRISSLLKTTFDLRAPPAVKVAFGPAYDHCMASGEAAQGVQSAVRDCIGAEYNRRDAELNRVYRAKMAGLVPERQSALRSDERRWLQLRELKCAVPAGGGTLQLSEATYCAAAETMHRTGTISSGQ